VADIAHPFNPESPLERIPGESLRANAALRDYALMGPGRSLRTLLEKYRVQRASGSHAEKVPLQSTPAESSPVPPTTRLATLFNWSRRFAWQERVEAWKAIHDAVEDRKWEKRRQKQRKNEWNLGRKIFKTLKAFYAETPKFTKTRRTIIKETGQEVITIGLDSNYAIKAAETFSKLGRLSSGMATDRQEHSGSVQITQPDSYADMSDEQLDQLIDNLKASS
jgi:hypothetical protein